MAPPPTRKVNLMTRKNRKISAVERRVEWGWSVAMLLVLACSAGTAAVIALPLGGLYDRGEMGPAFIGLGYSSLLGYATRRAWPVFWGQFRRGPR